MRIGKPVVFGTPVVMVTALVAALALWAWGPIGGDPTSNTGHGSSVVSVTDSVEVLVRRGRPGVDRR